MYNSSPSILAKISHFTARPWNGGYDAKFCPQSKVPETVSQSEPVDFEAYTVNLTPDGGLKSYIPIS